MVKVILKRDEEDRLLQGHPWIFDNELQDVKKEIEAGSLVEVMDYKHRFLAIGYYNPHSKIRVRVLTREHEHIDTAFFRRRIARCHESRQGYGYGASYRLVFGEADLLPGLIVDKFGQYLVIQTLTLGMDRLKPLILEALHAVVSPLGIYERNDVPIREKEGLEQVTGFLGEPFETKIPIQENGINLIVDVAEGQKTGHYFDQRENHAAIAPYVKGKRVLDTFCHTGGFALMAAKAGAVEVLAVDVSVPALEVLKQTAAANSIENITALEANVFDFLRAEEEAKKTWDVIILDPPAFCKSKSTLPGAYRGYKEINLRAMMLLKRGGILVTCSCSQAVTQELFLKMLTEAAADAKRSLQVIEIRHQAKDHPILMGYPESHYLKCVIARIL